MRILVVDDEPDVRFLFEEGIAPRCCPEEWLWEFATSGEAAMRRIAEHPHINVMLLDIMMPGVSGLDVLTRVKQADPYVIIVMLSAAPDLPKLRQAMNRGAFDFIPKPFELEDLLATLRKAEAAWRESQLVIMQVKEIQRLQDLVRRLVKHTDGVVHNIVSKRTEQVQIEAT